MSRKKTTAEDVETVETAVEEVSTEKQEVETAEQQITKTVYCGPTIKDVVKQYTVFEGRISDALTDYAAKHPTIKNLIVPLEKFAETRVKVETPNSAENIIYKKIAKETK